MMNTIFQNKVAQGWLSVYMDDIAIHTSANEGESESQHHEHHASYIHKVIDDWTSFSGNHHIRGKTLAKRSGNL
jgi:hypothetical protein